MRTLLLLACFCSVCSAQRYNVKFYRDEPTNSYEVVNGIPSLWPSRYDPTSVTNLASGYSTNWSSFQLSNHLFTLTPTYDSWASNLNFSIRSNSAIRIQEDRQRQIRVGTQPVTITTLSTNITFDYPMSASNYVVFFNPNGLNTVIGFANRSLTGFTATLSAGVTGTFAWMAVER
jgi:hypothetical protein